MLKEFKAFAMRGNVVDMAVGIIIGGAFGTIVKSAVDDLLMPPIGLLLGNVDLKDKYVLLKEGLEAPAPYASLSDAQAAGAVTLNWGNFTSAVVAFLIIAIAVFFLVRSLNRMYPPPQAGGPKNKECPYCATAIPLAATRCPQCTSQL